MNITIGEIIGNFILIAGSFLLLVFLIKKFAWDNIVGILDQRAQKISDDIDSAEIARKNAEALEQKREVGQKLLLLLKLLKKRLKKIKRVF